jgi:hypothetical protein
MTVYRALLLLMLIGWAGSLSAADPVAELLQPTALDREVDTAVVRAVQFLAESQRASGGWYLDMYGGETTSATSLSLMALLAAGHAPGEEPYAGTFRRGVDYLLRHQQPSGLIVDATGHGPLYCHGISTLLLAEIAGQVEPQQQQAVRQALERAVHALLESQAVRKDERHAGGWRYTLGSHDSDLSVTAWQLLALRGAKNIGCDIPADAIDRAVGYVKQCAQRQRGGFGYQPGHGATPTMTAAGITALQVCGAGEAAEVMLAVPVLTGRLPRFRERYYFYGAYYSSVALHQHGGDAWVDAKERLFRELVDRQNRDGSWLAVDGSEKPVGRVYATALAVLALTVEYGYLPIYQK